MGAANEWDRWSGNLSVGIVLRSGNTNQRDYGGLLFLRRETGKMRLDLKSSTNYGTLNGDKNVNNEQANVRLDVFLTKRLFVTPTSASVYADEFQNIDLRITLAAGVGYDIVDDSKLDWTAHVSTTLSTKWRLKRAGCTVCVDDEFERMRNHRPRARRCGHRRALARVHATPPRPQQTVLS